MLSVVKLFLPTGAFPQPFRCGILNLMLESVFGTIWAVVTLPFRVVVWVVETLGRLTGLVFGFVLMVVGVALWAGPLYLIGIPLFIVGLILTLRCLG